MSVHMASVVEDLEFVKSAALTGLFTGLSNSLPPMVDRGVAQQLELRLGSAVLPDKGQAPPAGLCTAHQVFRLLPSGDLANVQLENG